MSEMPFLFLIHDANGQRKFVLGHGDRGVIAMQMRDFFGISKRQCFVLDSTGLLSSVAATGLVGVSLSSYLKASGGGIGLIFVIPVIVISTVLLSTMLDVRFQLGTDRKSLDIDAVKKFLIELVRSNEDKNTGAPAQSIEARIRQASSVREALSCITRD